VDLTLDRGTQAVLAKINFEEFHCHGCVGNCALSPENQIHLRVERSRSMRMWRAIASFLPNPFAVVGITIHVPLDFTIKALS
jgi:hypothetical protein